MKVLLVDDDNLARLYLRQLIDWDSAGCVLVGDAANGKQALECIEETQPDIILTDISMPVLDGIGLIRALRARGSTAHIAVLSCHDEFDYVKEAMRLGADEYVLKNTLDADGLRKLLATLCADAEKAKGEQRDRDRLHALAERGSRTVLCELLDTLRRAPLPYDEQHAKTEQSGIALPLYQCAVVRAARAKAHDNVHCIEEEDGVTLLVDLTGLASAQAQREALDECVRTLTADTVAVSAVCSGDGGLTHALRQADTAWQHGFYQTGLCRHGELPALADALPVTADAALDLARLPACDETRFAEVFGRALADMQQMHVAPARVRAWIAHLDEAAALPQTDPPRRFADCRARQETYVRIFAERARRSALQATNPAVAQAAAYLRTHFAEPLSLAQVAEVVGLNATYLSFVFKRDTGINFSDYLLSCRMDEVKRRLRETTAPIKDIAEHAGFVDYRHFCKQFKKETGLRPADFRKTQA